MQEFLFLFILLFQPNNPNALIHFQPNSRLQKVGYWMVKEEIIPIIQQKLMSYVQDQLGADHNVIKNWDGYWFQVYGLTQKDGIKWIIVNAYSREFLLETAESDEVEHPLNLRTRMVMVSHKSESFFKVYMDPETLAFTWLNIR